MPEVEKISISGTPIDIVSSKVLQKPIGYSENHEVLFSGSTNNTSQIDEVGKSDGFIYNPGLKYITVGSNNTATSAYSVCFGSSSEARGIRSFAQGCGAKAHGEDSQSEGTYTTATHKSQHVFGEYNVLDSSVAESTEKGTYVEIVGNGTAVNARSNARTLDWSGNEVLAGKLTVGAAPTANMDVATKKYVDDISAKSHYVGDTSCEVNSSGLLNLSYHFNIPSNAYDINVQIIGDTCAPSSAVLWTNGSWYVFVVCAGTGDSIVRKVSTTVTARCSWKTP